MSKKVIKLIQACTICLGLITGLVFLLDYIFN